MKTHSAVSNRTAAFTLVEIMIVVVLVGLLCAMAVPQYQKVRTRSQDAAVLGNARQLASAAAQYYLTTGASSVETASLIGQEAYLKTLATVAGESYPQSLYANTPITVAGVAGARTLTYAP